jgi:uncharacterized membrane protein YvbJ
MSPWWGFAMANCGTCSALLPDGATFCPKCGTAVQPNTLPNAFELGKIAALASIRRDVLTWLGGSATVIAGVFAILAYFGVNETIKSTVAEQIKKELEKRDD